MQTVTGLEEIRPWADRAKRGEEEEFEVAAPVSQEEAGAFVFGVNQRRDGHVWMQVVSNGGRTTRLKAWVTP